MNDTDRRALLANAITELESLQRRRNELLSAYRTTEASAFARVRRLVRTIRGLPERAFAAAPKLMPPSLEAVDHGHDAGTLRARFRRVDTERAFLRDLLLQQREAGAGAEPYQRWLAANSLRPADVARLRALAPLLPYRPKISILVATYNTNETHLREAVASVIGQAYEDWELCIADDASPNGRVREVLSKLAAADDRIKVVFRTENGHISRATNSALAMATGEFIGLLDHDDLLTPDALFENVALLNRHPDADMIYSDEDKIDDDGALSEPHFKPDWGPESFLSRMYTCHFSVYRRSLAMKIGGYRVGFEGSQDHDFVLRLSEQTDKIHHISRVLYHWRIHANSTAASADAKPYAVNAGLQAVRAALERRGEPGVVSSDPTYPWIYIVRYEIRKRDRVSIIIPTRDHGEDVDRVLRSIIGRSTYDNFEILVVDNGSTDRASLEMFDKWAARDARISVLSYPYPFNFSAMNNFAVRSSTGRYVLLLNNDVEAITNDWIEAMVEQSQRPAIGVVGGLLLYADDTVQHAGVIIGIGGVAGHGHKYFPREHPGWFGMLRSINNYSALTAACIMVRREVYDQVGGLDETLAIAFNDVDFSLKVRSAGYRNVYLPHVKLYHFESKSRGAETTPGKVERFNGEAAVMKSRWGTDTSVDPFYNVNLSLTHEDFSLRI